MEINLSPRLRQKLTHATRVTVLTGSGLAEESGILSAQAARTGHWATYDIIELATPQAFARNARLVWEWYSYRRSQAERVSPSDAHYAIVDLEQYYPEFTLVTQAIDGLHWRAGNRDMVELYGSLARVRCYECGGYAQGWDDERESPPRCAHCGGWLRPDVVLYGEGLAAQDLRRSEKAAEQSDLFLIIGTTAMVQPAASLPLLARRGGAYLVEINPEETALSLLADERLPYRANDSLPWIAEWLARGTRSIEEGA